MENKIKGATRNTAKLFCVTPPAKEQKSGIADFLQKKYGVRPEIEVVEDKSLISGFRLHGRSKNR